MRNLISFVLVLLLAGTATAGGTLTASVAKGSTKALAKVLKMDCTADAADASFDSTAFDEATLGQYSKEGWWLISVRFVFDASTTPDADFDVTITDSLTPGIDLLGGAGASLDGTGDDIEIVPYISSSDTSKFYKAVVSELTLNITNNSTNSAGVDVYLILARD
jgi:hypothetical protein